MKKIFTVVIILSFCGGVFSCSSGTGGDPILPFSLKFSGGSDGGCKTKGLCSSGDITILIEAPTSSVTEGIAQFNSNGGVLCGATLTKGNDIIYTFLNHLMGRLMLLVPILILWDLS